MLALLIVALSAHAGDLTAQVGTSLRGSSWAGDYLGGSRVGFGYRFAEAVSVDVIVWEELGTVDTRLDTGLTFGVSGVIHRDGARPVLRLYGLHQHEEGMISVAKSPFTVVAGIGPGIRHRAGVGGWVGAEIPFAERKKVEWFVLPGFDTTWFPDDALGPGIYAGATVAVGLHYRIEDLP